MKKDSRTAKKIAEIRKDIQLWEGINPAFYHPSQIRNMIYRNYQRLSRYTDNLRETHLTFIEKVCAKIQYFF